MKKALGTIVQYVIFLGLGIWIIYSMLHQLKGDERTQLVYALKNANYWLMIPVFIVGLLSHIFRALRWRLLLNAIQVHPSIVNTTFAVLIGYIVNLAIPRAGEVAKCTVLARYDKAPVDKMIGTIVAERVFDVLCLVIITVVTFAFQAGVIGSFATGLLQKGYAAMQEKKIFLIIGLIGAIAFIVVLIWVYRKYRATKIGGFIKQMSSGVLSIFRMKRRGAFLVYTVLIWFMYVLQIYIVFLSLAGTSHLGFPAALVVLVFGSAGMIITPGGIGAYPKFVSEILPFYGVSLVWALAFGWLAWAATTAVVIVLGVISLLLVHPYNRKKQHAQVAMDTA